MRSSSSDYFNPPQSLYSAPRCLLTPVKSVFKSNKKTLKSLPVRSKIILGYVLAVSIPVIGTCVGLMVGNRYQKAATQTLAITHQEKNYLNELQSEILRNRIAKELGPFVEDAEAFKQASKRMKTRLDRIQNLVVQLEAGQTKSVIAFAPQLQTYKQTAYQFSHKLEVLTELSTSEFSSSDRAEQRILELAKGDAFREFISFSEQVDIVSKALDKDLLEAQAELQKSELFRIEIIVGSLVASMGVASVLAFFTSQAISRPLEVLTNVAQQVTREANADIRAPVLTKDEIGTLAIALNQLIAWVDIYTTELKDAQLHLIQAEKMSSVGQLVAGVAHEINNPVNFIHGNIQPIHRYMQDLLDVVHAYQSQYPSPPQPIQEILEEVDLDFLETDAEKLLKSMKVGSERIREIVLSLRNFSRLDESESKAVDIHEGIDNTLLILQHRLKADNLKADNSKCEIEVVKSYGKLPLINCYPGQLNQVFMNLLVNAIDALEASYKQAGEENPSPKSIWISTQVILDKTLQIAIADNGVGMSQKVRSRILDPFFTTKPIGQGTGLGLSISYQIITEQHKGQMTCESTPGKGTTFTIEIPIR